MLVDSTTLDKAAALTLITVDLTGMQLIFMRINSAIGSMVSIIAGLVYLGFYVGGTAILACGPILGKQQAIR